MRSDATTVARIILIKKILLVVDLMGFAASILGLVGSLYYERNYWLFAASGMLCSLFAWKFVGRMIDFFMTWLMAAQAGTIYAVTGKALDNLGCGDPDCEGCSKAREKKDA